ncbi:solute carrier organic anion transporter family member 74D-like [Oppia nitens]|uniref:solute carrier organic anion transporter family member 74D-like n=1 Tax=Oppia nitens TaxID=1686743 RepID=UPI0023DCE1AD|nr:solute carrier organic anion transporter family member 74D-like [Oppia nitens]
MALYKSDTIVGSSRRWQLLSSPKTFMLSLGLVGILQGASYWYVAASLSTLERRYAFDSFYSGLILIADNITEFLCQPIFGYLAHRIHRPRMIGYCQVITAVGLFLAAVPFFVYGPGYHMLGTTANNIDSTSTSNNSTEFCDANRDLDNLCCKDREVHTALVSVLCIWFATFLNGIGSASYYSLGIPFVDDSVKKKNSPLYMSLTACLRLLGPTLGYIISSIFLRFYENPFYDPGIELNDPRWVGAWWLGFIMLGVFILIGCIPMFLFPDKLVSSSKSKEATGAVSRKQTKQNSNSQHVPDIKTRLRRLLTNPIYMCVVISTFLRLFGVVGYMAFKPKYLESQYHKSASAANLITGIVGIVPSATGILIGGAFITYFMPSPLVLTSFTTLVELFGTMGFIGALFLGCPSAQFSNLPNSNLNICNSNCTCSQHMFQPICGSDNITNYFSPCYAGCPPNSLVNSINGTIKQFIGCDCIDGVATDGYCDTNCGNNFQTYVTLLGFGSLVATLARSGNVIISFRIVDKLDKSLAIGLSGAIMGLFAFIPCTMVFGAVTNSACMIWESKCGQTGNCLVYDSDKFRRRIHGLTLGLYFAGSVFDLIVVLLSSRIKNLYNDDTDDDDDDD